MPASMLGFLVVSVCVFYPLYLVLIVLICKIYKSISTWWVKFLQRALLSFRPLCLSLLINVMFLLSFLCQVIKLLL